VEAAPPGKEAIMNTPLEDTTREWVRDHAHPLEDLRPVVAAAKAAAVVGVGENTRESAEIDRHRVDLVKALVEEAGYRVVVIPDSANVAERMDAYVLGEREDLREVVLSGWLPNRTEATAELLTWLRAFNTRHPAEPVHVVGNGPRQTEPQDYDRVLAAVERIDPVSAAGVRERYEVIRTAHDVNEHIQIHQGTHPGRPFAELAGEALDLVRVLAPEPDILALAEQVLGFHANSVAARPDFGEVSRAIAERITAAHEKSGRKVVYFDGFALTGVLADAEVAISPGKPFTSAGKLLRERFGDGYVSVLLAFGSGTIRGGLEIPEPAEGNVERTLLEAGDGGVLLPLADGGWPGGATRLRIIAGVYDPAEDGKHSIDLPSLPEAADFLGFVPVISQTRPLGEVAAAQ
jgi:erythromycin esterase